MLNPILGAGTTVVLGIFGLYLITSAKSPNMSNQPDTLNTSKTSLLPNHLDSLLKNAEMIVGDYIAHGKGGSVFLLPSGDALKVVALDKKFRGMNINQDQADFIEKIWLDKRPKKPFSNDFVEIKFYNRGYAGPKMVELVNAESPDFQENPLLMGQPIAYWVMEYVPTIGKGEMSDARIRGGIARLQEYGAKYGYELKDLKNERNYGQRDDGSFVAFDVWPDKIGNRPTIRSRDD